MKTKDGGKELKKNLKKNVGKLMDKAKDVSSQVLLGRDYRRGQAVTAKKSVSVKKSKTPKYKKGGCSK